MGRELVFVAISLVLLISEGGPTLHPPKGDASGHYDSTIKSVDEFHDRIEKNESSQRSLNPLEYTPVACVLLALTILAAFIAYKEKKQT